MSSKKKVKESLLDQLRKKGDDPEYMQDMIDDYLNLWEIKKHLIADIKTRGVMYNDYSSTGVLMQKNNPSTKELVMVNRQMLAILRELGLHIAEPTDEDDEL